MKQRSQSCLCVSLCEMMKWWWWKWNVIWNFSKDEIQFVGAFDWCTAVLVAHSGGMLSKTISVRTCGLGRTCTGPRRGWSGPTPRRWCWRGTRRKRKKRRWCCCSACCVAVRCRTTSLKVLRHSPTGLGFGKHFLFPVISAVHVILSVQVLSITKSDIKKW